MSNKLNIDSVDDNKIIVNGKEYFGFGISNVFVGEFPNVERFDAEGNLNPNGNFTKDIHGVLIKITSELFTDAKEVYNLSTQRHHNWVLIDLETGRGGGWYPGSKQYCYTLHKDVMLKKEPLINSDSILHIGAEASRLEILDNTYDQNNNLWYFVSYEGNTPGFILSTDVSKIEFNNY